MTPKQTAKLQAKWNKILAKDGNGLLGSMTSWTFRGKARDKNSGATFVSFTARDAKYHWGGTPRKRAQDRYFDRTELFEDEAIASSVWELPVARWFRELSHAVTEFGHQLPPQHRAFLVAYSDLGYLSKAGKPLGIGKDKGAKILADFCAAHVLGKPPELHGPGSSRAKGWETRKEKT